MKNQKLTTASLKRAKFIASGKPYKNSTGREIAENLYLTNKGVYFTFIVFVEMLSMDEDIERFATLTKEEAIHFWNNSDGRINFDDAFPTNDDEELTTACL